MRNAFSQWWHRYPWMVRLMTGKRKSSEDVSGAPDVRLPEMSRKFITGTEGLTDQHVQERYEAKQVNITHPRTSRTYRQIFIANTFTRFNALLGSLYIIILFVGNLQDSVFGIILVANTFIGIIQELRAKWTLDKLALVMVSRSKVVRSGKIQTIPTNKIVIDDVIELTSGDQVAVDGVTLQSDNLEVNESMITGESESVTKKPGDPLYSGSFIVAGHCRMQAVHIGENAYARRLANAVREFTLAKSELRNGINKMLRIVTWVLPPAAVLLLVSQLFNPEVGLNESLASFAGGVVNMVPDGLVLLTSVVMTIAILRLSKHDVLIQELPAVEMLARVNVLCLDKTGTLTEGVITAKELLPIKNPNAKVSPPPSADPREIVSVFAQVQEQSSTLAAIARAYPAPQPGKFIVQDNIPFSSTRKWSALTFNDYGTWILGAPEMILTKPQLANTVISGTLDRLADSGQRVLLLAYSKEPVSHAGENSDFTIMQAEPVALVILEEQIRKGVKKTLQYFKEQGVAVKIISGDNPRTVATIAKAAGLEVDIPQNGRELPQDIDELGELVERKNVFGRVMPEQKKLMVTALKKRGYVVAMVGDGVNDVLAIKEADFSIAMGSGTDASRGTAQLVLLKNSFLALPDVIAEGRRIIGNIERSANLFIAKTVYITIIALAIGLSGSPFPFLPRHFTLISSLTIGIPAMILSFTRNSARAKPGFASRVASFSLPAGIIICILTLVGYAVTRLLEPANFALARTAATIILLGCGFALLVLLAIQARWWQKFLLAGLVALMFVVFAVPWLRNFFALTLPTLRIWAILVLIVGIGIIALWQVKKSSLAKMTES
jgi:cation-transporting ATPase E